MNMLYCLFFLSFQDTHRILMEHGSSDEKFHCKICDDGFTLRKRSKSHTHLMPRPFVEQRSPEKNQYTIYPYSMMTSPPPKIKSSMYLETIFSRVALLRE